MKYLLVTLEYPPFFGGIAHYYGHLVKNFPGTITVLDNSQGQLVNEHLLWKWWPAIRSIWRAVQEEKINYILVGHILPLGTAVWLLAKFLPLKYCLFLHGYDLNCALRQPRKAKLALKILDQAHQIICANSYTAKQVKVIIDQKQLGKVKVVNPGVGVRPTYDQVAVRRLQDSYDLLGKTVVLAVGRLVERKGFDTLIDSVPLVNRVLPNVVYYLAGTGPDEQYLRDKVKALPSALQKKVTFLGKISEEEKWRWLDACTMLAMPARAIGDDIEGFGIVYLEANLAGKPVIAGRSGGVEDAVQDNINGLVVEPTSHQQLAEAIIRLASYQGLAQRLGDQGRQRARQEFAWSKQANKIYDIIKS